jgi:hypothetical protein
MKLKLKGISQKGKQRIKDWGEEWEVVEIRSERLLVRSIVDSKGDSIRWIDVEDTDMEIMYEPN